MHYAFLPMKERLLTAPVLSYPEFYHPSKVKTDVLGRSVVVVLVQEK